MKEFDIGNDLESGKVCILHFADDIVIIAEDETQLQILFDFDNDWCKKWKMKVNNSKTIVVHFRKK